MLTWIPEKGWNETRKENRRIDNGLHDVGDKRRNYEQICTNIAAGIKVKSASTTDNEGNTILREILSCMPTKYWNNYKL